MKFKHYLIASEENNYEPWITKASALAAFCLIIWAIRFLLPTITIASPGIDSYDVMAKINNERTQRFLPSLITNGKLLAAANIKSNDMLKRSYFSHVDPDGNYVWPTIIAQGYTPYSTLGENLAIDFFSASSVVDAWMNSPSHRANILNQKFEDQGLAAVYGNFEPEHDTYAIASLFGALFKKSTPPPPQPPALTPTPTPNPIPPPVISKPKPTPLPSPMPSPSPTPPATDNTTNPENLIASSPLIPMSQEAYFIKTLRVVFTIFALIYLFFLSLDSIIIYKARIKRTTMHSSTHSLLFFLIAAVNIITTWF